MNTTYVAHAALQSWHDSRGTSCYRFQATTSLPVFMGVEQDLRVAQRHAISIQEDNFLKGGAVDGINFDGKTSNEDLLVMLWLRTGIQIHKSHSRHISLQMSAISMKCGS